MKKFLFITDFDGTVTAQDFFVQIAYRYKHKNVFSKREKSGFELLSEVFGNLHLTQNEILNEIKHVAFDFNFVNFVKCVKALGGQVLVLSAGASYYVENKLKMENLYDEVEVIANDSCYQDGGIKMFRRKNWMFYDEKFGINKLKIVNYYRNKFEILAYAGDSYVDFDGCRICDFKFAKGNLAKILDLFYIDHYKFFNFAEVEKILHEIFK